MPATGKRVREEHPNPLDSPTLKRLRSPGHHKVKCAFNSTYPEGVQISEANVEMLTAKSKSRQAVTFDEITLSDQPVSFHPNDVQLKSHITRNIYLKGCGIMTAAMDTVTEGEMALAMAKMGGIGIIHRNLSAEEQASQVKWVRRKIHFGGMITKPITFNPDTHISTFQHAIKEKGFTFTSFPVVDDDNKFLGLVTRTQLEFVDDAQNPTLRDVMLPKEKLVWARHGTKTDDAFSIMHDRKVKKLPVVGEEGNLEGMYVWNDVKDDRNKEDRFSLDQDGHFLVGAAIGVGDNEVKRANILIEAGCKLLVIDSSHGSCGPVKNTLLAIRAAHGDKVEIIAGNIASYASAMWLLQGEARPDALKVGIGPGSICTTRQVTGHGIPQVTAIFEVWRAVRDFGRQTGYYVPVIADGGIRTSGDIVKALAAGANGIMLGSVFAGTAESPGMLVEKHGRKYKTIRGMGSRSAMEERSGSRMRYHRQDDSKMKESVRLTKGQAQKMVPEGVEGLVEYRGTVDKVMMQLLGGVQSGLCHTGAKNIKDFQASSEMWIQSVAGMKEGRPHDIADVRD